MNFIFVFTLALALVFLPSLSFAGSIETSAKQAIILDFETGQVLFKKNADERMPTSSMSKVITAYAVMAEIKADNLSLEDELHVSEKAWKKQGSKMFVKVDTKVTVKDLLKGVVIQSGNDATIVLAEGIAGSEEKFADHLNKVALKLGMTNSHFTNASGWPDPEHYSTARDLATLAQHAIKDFPEFYPYYAEREFTYNNITQKNRNPLFKVDIGADGIKTGYTEAAGYGIMASAVNPKDGRRVIVVINGVKTSKARSEEAKKLVSWALNGFKNKKIIDIKTNTYNVPLLYGKSEYVPAGVKEDLVLTVEKLADSEFSSRFTPTQNLTAPVTQGDVIGRVEILKGDKLFKRVEVIAQASVEELGAFKKLIAKAKHSFANRK